MAGSAEIHSTTARDRARFEQHWKAPDGTTVTIRAIRQGDIALEVEFLAGLSKESLYQRVFSTRGLLPGELKRLTQVDFEREVALVATVRAASSETGSDDDREHAVGIARYVVTPGGDECEFAIVIADAWQGKHLGRQLLGALIGIAKAAGLRRMVGSTFATNDAMKRMARKTGFVLDPDPDDSTMTSMSMLL
jgi:acetyltransferase